MTTLPAGIREAWIRENLQRGTYTLVYDATFATGTSQPTVLTDASMVGLAAGGRAVGAADGTLGIVAGSFASSGAETGTGGTQGGLGSAAASNQPYNTTDFAGGRYPGVLVKNGRAVLLREMLSTAVLDLDAEVVPFVAYRSDAAANNKWRVWWYYVRAADGLLAPFTPNISVTSATLLVPQVVLRDAEPAASGFTGATAAFGALELTAALVGDLQPLGAAAIGTTGRVLDAGTVLPDTGLVRTDGTHAMAAALPMGNNDIGGIRVAYSNGVIDDGNSGTSKTIDWTLGTSHKITMTGNCTFSFTAPPGPCWLQLRMTQDGTGGHTAVWPSMKWAGGSAQVLTPTLTTGMDIVSIYYDESAYYGIFAAGFA
jgi:hypothetical protein